MKEFDFSIVEYLDEHGIRYKEASGGRQLILETCPRCGKSKKFYISLETGQFICHSCASRDKDMVGGPVKLLMLLSDLSFKEALRLIKGKEVKVAKSESELSTLLDGLEIEPYSFFKNKKRFKEKEKPESLRLPNTFVPLYETHPGFKYLLSRGLDKKDILSLGILVTKYFTREQAAKGIARSKQEEEKLLKLFKKAYEEKSTFQDLEIERYIRLYELPLSLKEALKDAYLSFSYRGRVIFPVFVDEKLFGWVARDYSGKSKLKVKNSVGTFKQFFVWNFDQAKDSKELVIAEGIVSAIQCGIERSVATLGKLVTDQQIQLLRKTKAEDIFICLDPDAQDEALNLKRRLLPFFKNVYNVSLPRVKIIKCPKCQAKIPLDLKTDLGAFNCPKCKEKLSSLVLKELLSEADFKDAGDYTKKEMAEFILKAKEEDQDDLLLRKILLDD